MTKHYKTPILLIEFDGDKAFALQVRSAAAPGGWQGHLCLACRHLLYSATLAARDTPAIANPCHGLAPLPPGLQRGA